MRITSHFSHFGSIVDVRRTLINRYERIVGDLIEDYETAHLPLPDVTGVQALRFLMEQHGIKQSDLHEIGSEGVVSEILTGKRDLNIRQVRALSERFGVSPATFV